MVDHDHPAARQERGECDPTGEGSQDRLTHRAGEVDAAVTGAEGGVGWVEGPHDLGLRLERPHPDRNRVHGDSERTGLAREGEQRGRQHGDDSAQRRPVDPDRGGG